MEHSDFLSEKKRNEKPLSGKVEQLDIFLDMQICKER